MGQDYGPFWNTVMDFQTIGVVGLTAIGYFLKSKYERWRDRKRLSASLLAELESIELRYLSATNGGITADIIKPNEHGEYTLFSLPISQNYFTVYEETANKIDLFSADNAASIVGFYTTAKGFIDTLRAWDEKVHNYLKVDLECKRDGTRNTDCVKQALDPFIENLPVDYVTIIEEQDRLLEKLRAVKHILKNI